jgi:hypothetical protein
LSAYYLTTLHLCIKISNLLIRWTIKKSKRKACYMYGRPFQLKNRCNEVKLCYKA